jgi:hypothetical protein
MVSQERRIVGVARDARPMLLTVIHTEEEFDWSKPFDRGSTAMTHMREIGRLHDIFDKRDVPAVYMVDYPAASDTAAVAALNARASAGKAAIGAHLHPWVNPPFVEAVSSFNSYPGNLAGPLELAKLETLTRRIEQGFGHRPVAYLAGRYGFGERSLPILQQLGYRLDLSAVAFGDFRSDGGPDFRGYDSNCFWEGTPPVLRIPHSSADIGFLCRNARRRVDTDRHAAMRRLHVPGVLSRLGAVRRVRLTPEGFSLPDLVACAQALIAAGIRVLVFSFHSPSVAPGFTPYVRDQQDRAEFLSRIDGFLQFFREECDGQFVLPDAVPGCGTGGPCPHGRAEIFDCRTHPQPPGVSVDGTARDQTATLRQF